VIWSPKRDEELDLVANRKGSQQIVLDTRKARKLSPRRARKLLKEARRKGVYIGNDRAGNPIYSMGEGGILIVGGARSGKGLYILTTMLNSGYEGDILLIDPKFGENTYQLKKLNQRHIVCFMTEEMPGLGVTASANMWGHLIPGSNLVGDVRVAAANFLGYTGDAKHKYFEVGGRERFLTPVIVQEAESRGEVSVPRVADLFMGFLGNSPEWAGFEFDMYQSQYPFVRAMAPKFKKFRTEGFGSGGEEGMLGEVLNAFVCMNDPRNRRMVSPPYTFDFSVLGKEPNPDDPTDWPYTISILMTKDQLVTAGDACLARGFSSAIMHYKSRSPLARPLLSVYEEAGNLAPWPSLVHAFTEQTGFNARPVVILQSPKQGDDLADNGFSIMAQSASAHVALGVRDHEVGEVYSKRLGSYQVAYQNDVKTAELQARMANAKRKALTGDQHSMHDVRELAAALQATELETRAMRDPVEFINNTPKDRGFAWIDEVKGPIDIQFRPFYEMLPVGSYDDNPHYWRTNGENRLIVPKRFGRGTTTREMIEIDVPEEFQDGFHFRYGRMPCRVLK